jgi:hypothetical protein
MSRGAWRSYNLVQHILGFINMRRPIAAPLLIFNIIYLITSTCAIIQLVTADAVASIIYKIRRRF